mmetsp:Transcript_69015/g.223091  ORF Transcript_69015/g.223091 Transcript_69015/m.223091 type:complete len:215 (-) Transcript_69015:777-1421(-)
MYDRRRATQEADRTRFRSPAASKWVCWWFSVMASKPEGPLSTLLLAPGLPPIPSSIFFNEVRRPFMSLLGAVVILFSRRRNSGLVMNSSFGVSPSRLPFRMPLLKSSSIFFSFSLRTWSILGSTCLRVAVTFLWALRMTSVGSASESCAAGAFASFIQRWPRASSADTRFFGSCSNVRFKKSRPFLLSFALVCHLIGSVRILTMISRGCFASYG